MIGAVFGLGLVTGTDAIRPGWTQAGVSVIALVVVSALAVPGQRLRAATEIAPPTLLLAGLAMLRHGGGGPASVVGGLVILPVLFVALYFGPRALAAVVVAAAGVYFLPILLVGPPDYPSSEWRRGALVVVVNTIMGLAVQGVVHDARARALVLQAVGGFDRHLDPGAEPRQEVVRQMALLGEADVAVLLEPAGGDDLAPSAAEGLDPPEDLRVDLADPTSEIAAACRTGETTLVPPAALAARTPSLAAAAGLRSAIVQPVIGADRLIGVVVLGYRTPLRVLPERTADAVAALSAVVATAIERSDHLAELREQADTDGLTGVANRRTFDRFLGRALAGAGRSGAAVSVAVLDLDRFKQFNDTRGHQAGDALLRDAVSVWRHQPRAGDLLARYGGDEFAVVLVGASSDVAVTVADRMRSRLPEGATVSIGVATWDGAEPAETLLGRADRALYDAKQAGRDRVALGS